MNETAVPSPTMITFVIRFWRETSAGKVRWRGRIEHVQGRRQADFLDVDGLVAFLNHYGIVTVPRSTNSVEDKDRTRDV